MTSEYHAMETDFFGMPGALLNTDCEHRTGFTHISSKLIKHNPDDSVLARTHELECLTCGHVWQFTQKALPARD